MRLSAAIGHQGSLMANRREYYRPHLVSEIMKTEIIVGVVGGVLTATILWAWNASGKVVQAWDAKGVAEKIVAETELREQLLAAMAEDPAFEPRHGVDVPTGAIVAWPGELPEDLEWNKRWHVCNGKPVVYTEELWLALRGLYGNDEKGSTIILPDFQGMFLRGQGGSDPHVSNPLGDEQHPATAGPTERLAFAGGEHGHEEHSHQVGGRNGPGGAAHPNKVSQGGESNGGTAFTTSSDPIGSGGSAHSHSVTGWDAETRPVNYAVHWIIRVR